MTHHDAAALRSTLAASARLRAAYRDTRNAPPVGDFHATITDLAARAEVAPVVTAWSLDVKVSK